MCVQANSGVLAHGLMMAALESPMRALLFDPVLGPVSDPVCSHALRR